MFFVQFSIEKKSINLCWPSAVHLVLVVAFFTHNKCNPHSASSLATLCTNNGLSSPRILISKYDIWFLLVKFAK